MKIRSWNIDPISLFLIFVGAVLFLPFLGRVHLFDWDEINFAECAREMIISKQYFLVTVNYIPFWEKPPLFIWMQAASMKLLGVSAYAARLPNAICGIATLVLLYHAGTTFRDKRFGILWSLAYVCSMLPFFYFKSGIIDPWFNFFTFSGFYFFIRYRIIQKEILQGSNYKWLAVSALCFGLAILSKGPIAFLIFFLSALVYMVLEKGKAPMKILHAGLFLLILVLSGGTWFFAEIITGHQHIVMDFIQYQMRLFNTEDADHGGPFYYHFIVLLFGCFPASVFAINGMFISGRNDKKFGEAARWMAILFWVVLIIFSIVKTKIIHYSSLCYYPLTFFAAWSAYQLWIGARPWKRWISWGIASIGFVIGAALLLLPLAGMHIKNILGSGIVKDPFTAASLMADVGWSFGDLLIGLFFIAMIITALLFLKRKRIRIAIITIYFATLITTYSTLLFLAPKIEQYTQGATVEFYENLQGKDVYVATLGYKSYAQYFYSRELPWQNANAPNPGWLLDSNIDKPAYFSCKIEVAEDYMKDHPLLKELYRKNGFVFFFRNVSK